MVLSLAVCFMFLHFGATSWPFFSPTQSISLFFFYSKCYRDHAIREPEHKVDGLRRCCLLHVGQKRKREGSFGSSKKLDGLHGWEGNDMDSVTSKGRWQRPSALRERRFVKVSCRWIVRRFGEALISCQAAVRDLVVHLKDGAAAVVLSPHFFEMMACFHPLKC